MTGDLTLEVTMRLKSSKGHVVSEYTVRGHTVSIMNFYPSGALEDHGELSLPEFLREVSLLRASSAERNAKRSSET